ncbi:uncharacterized protein LOC106155941 [Lingula anatina]|uniref:Uncharacterized protein LOC106155941 n=1 Tax=Lingula anatina TaxID=7574 RepID=A0A1S3HN18_LINAN|nr:uncharacterized protein LOC106155941 [Lingula anatina]|eukprot:XP_013386439.1 uncharacterized protein LOC106155941 [Lingula anatina]
MKTCCCCWGLRQGTIASAVWTLVLGCLNSCYGIYALVAEYQDGVTNPHAQMDGIYSSPAVLVMNLVLYLIWIAVSIVTIIAAVMANRFLLLPWILTSFLYVIYTTILIILICVNEPSSPVAWMLFVTCVIIMAVNIYALTCVVSFYIELGKKSTAYRHTKVLVTSDHAQ